MSTFFQYREWRGMGNGWWRMVGGDLRKVRMMVMSRRRMGMMRRMRRMRMRIHSATYFSLSLSLSISLFYIYLNHVLTTTHLESGRFPKSSKITQRSQHQHRIPSRPWHHPPSPHLHHSSSNNHVHLNHSFLHKPIPTLHIHPPRCTRIP